MTKTTASHYERCKPCKEAVLTLLKAAYKNVTVNYQTLLPTRIEEYSNHPHRHALEKIYKALCQHRGHENFVKAKHLPTVDYFVSEPARIIEFDESQHFTPLRQLTLELYPPELKLGFSRDRWISLCSSLNKRDNSPPYRDEQRAWYDTLRDFAFFNARYMPTVRLYAKDNIWCSFTDINNFKQLIESAGK